MTRKAPIDVLEAAYSFDTSEKDWLSALSERLAPFDLGGGSAIYVSAVGVEIGVRTAVCATDRITEENLREVVRKVPAKVFRRAHAPAPLRFSGEYFPVTTERAHAKIASGLSFDVPIGWGLCAGDPSHETIALVLYCDRNDVLSERDRVTLDCIGAHLGSALRIRALVTEKLRAEDPSVAAVLTPDGKILHAEEGAQREQQSLVDAVRQSERARLRGATEEERLDLWTALVEGRWSVLEHFERDGRRVLLACRNEPRVAVIRALTARECAVAQYAALGHPHKFIAYELGVSIATVSGDLEQAKRKLGLSSLADLAHLYQG